MNSHGAKAIARSLTYTYWVKPRSTDQARKMTRHQMEAESNNKTKELWAIHKRLTSHYRPGFEKIKLREQYVRNYDQHKAAIFCLQILGKKKVAIPLR